MDFAAILEKIISLGGPSMAVACLFLWYMHHQIAKKDETIAILQASVKEHTTEHIKSLEKNLQNTSEFRALLDKVVDRSAASQTAVTEFFGRLEMNQKDMLEELRKLKS